MYCVCLCIYGKLKCVKIYRTYIACEEICEIFEVKDLDVIFRGNGNKNKILLIVQYKMIYMSHNMLMIYKN